jgi:hypothetical protein
MVAASGHRPLFLQEELGFRATAAALRILPVQARQHPAEQPANAKYKLFIEAWRRMPLGLANLIGPHIVRNLG